MKDYSQSPLSVFDQRMEDYFKTETTQTKAEFWWNHLTFKQREFIVKECQAKRIVYGPEFSIDEAHKTNWQSVEGYPK
jgi:hypothetical protein